MQQAPPESAKDACPIEKFTHGPGEATARNTAHSATRASSFAIVSNSVDLALREIEAEAEFSDVRLWRVRALEGGNACMACMGLTSRTGRWSGMLRVLHRCIARKLVRCALGSNSFAAVIHAGYTRGANVEACPRGVRLPAKDYQHATGLVPFQQVV